MSPENRKKIKEDWLANVSLELYTCNNEVFIYCTFNLL